METVISNSKPLKWLIYGHKGWIGGQVIELLLSMGEIVLEGKSRADNYEQTLKEIKEANPNRVLCLIGRTHGPGFANIDYLE